MIPTRSTTTTRSQGSSATSMLPPTATCRWEQSRERQKRATLPRPKIRRRQNWTTSPPRTPSTPGRSLRTWSAGLRSRTLRNLTGLHSPPPRRRASLLLSPRSSQGISRWDPLTSVWTREEWRRWESPLPPVSWTSLSWAPPSRHPPTLPCCQ